MKIVIYIFSVFSLLLVGCEFDNYEPPTSMLSGRIVYEDTPIGVRNGLDVIQLYEHGWQNFEPISVKVKPDGTFSSLLFEGDYKLVRIQGNGPWINNPDTIDVEVRGAQTTIDVPVEPFFMIRNEAFELNGSTLTATFNIDDVAEAANLQRVSLFIGKTMLVDNLYNIGNSAINGAAVGDLSEKITLEIDVSGVSEDFVFARIGVTAVGNPEFAFTQVQKIEL